MELEDVKKLARLARIEMSDEEMLDIAKDFGAILAYVGQIQEVSKLKNIENLHQNSNNYFLQNVTREDVSENKRGEYTDRIMANVPDKQDGFLKVKQIF